MTTTTLPPRRRWSRERIASCVGALAVGVVGLVAIGRFVAPRDAGRSAPAALTAAPATLGEALTAAERRTVERPTDPAAWTALGSLAVRQAAATGDPAFYLTARSALDEARRLAPDSIDVLVADGALALAVHDFTSAAELAEAAVSAAPFTAEAYAVAVDAAVELGDYDLAEARLQALLDLKPDAAALTRTSYLRELHGDLAGATGALRAAEGRHGRVGDHADHGVDNAAHGAHDPRDSVHDRRGAALQHAIDARTDRRGGGVDTQTGDDASDDRNRIDDAEGGVHDR
jgi:tetratricopeptide (TPR) repeat protein